jgi:type I restriction-modification system DNA methylase subunit
VPLLPDIIREAQIHFALHRALMNIIKKKRQFDHVEFKKTEPEYPIKGIGRADLVLSDKVGTKWLVIETKSSLKANDPYEPKVIDQALRYASWLGAYYFATCDGKTFVLFDNKEKGVEFWERKRIPPYDLTKEKSLEDFAEKLLQDIVNLEFGIKKWSALDEAFVHRLKVLHERLVPLIFESIDQTAKADKKFRVSYEEWLDKQGLKIDEKINHKIAIEVAYMLINKILFYKILETKYKDLPKLQKINLLISKDSINEFREKLEHCFKEALKIDYQGVFKPSIYDEIPLPQSAVERLNGFLNEASSYDISKIEADVIGRIYEGLIPKDERRMLGQYYTPPAICDLIVKMCVKNANSLILDPGCGSAGFLVKAYYRLLELKGKKTSDEETHQEILKQLWGIDISQFPAHLSVINIAMRNLKAKSDIINIIPNDFFKVLPQQKTFKAIETATLSEIKGTYELLPQFDAIVCNPPYTRQDDIGNRKYREYIRKVALSFDGELKISSEAGIYAYFFTHSAHFLKQKGMFGYIVSNSWMDVKFGIAIQKFFLDNFRIISIIEFDRRAFAEAAINTVILIAQKLTGKINKKERDENLVKFVRVKSALRTEDIIKRIEEAPESYENEEIRVVIKRQADLSADTKWLKYLRAPPIYFKILDNPKITRLGKIAKINIGIITYANDFFILSTEQLKKWGIEKKYLRPILTSPKDLQFLDVKENDAKNYLFYVNEPKTKLKGTQALEYIKWGESTPVEITRGAEKGTVVKGFQNIPSFRSRNKEMWYSIGERKPSPILVPRLIWERIFAAYNEAGCLTTHAFYGITPTKKKDTFPLLGILNSTMFDFVGESSGRTTLGEGVLELMEHEWNNLPVVDTRKLTKDEWKKLYNSTKSLQQARRLRDNEAESKAHQELDTEIFGVLGLNMSEREQILKGFSELREIRKQRVGVEVLIEHPETKKPTRRIRKLKEFMPKEETLTKWTDKKE